MENNTIDTAKVTSEFVEEQAASWKAAAAAVTKTANMYLDDVKHRKDTLQVQSNECRNEMDALKKKRDELAAHIADLSSRGDIDAATAADIDLEALDQQIHALGRKLKIVNGATPKGDAQFYAAAQAAYSAMIAERTPYINGIDNLGRAVDAEIERLQAIKRDLSFARDKNHGYYAGQLWEKVNRHYNELDRIEQEHREQEAAERKAEAAKTGHTRHYFA